MALIDTGQAAARLGVSRRRVRQLIDDKKLAARWLAGGWVIEEAELSKVKTYGKPGRPPKVPKQTAAP